jgi:glutathione S-transferase
MSIGDNPYFLGDFSLTDVALVPRFLKMESFGVLPASSLPRLSAWLQKMKERPSVKASSAGVFSPLAAPFFLRPPR